MKIFKFIGSIMDHTESLVDATFGTVVTASNTIGIYATHQETVAKASGDYIVKTALLELEDEYESLLAKRAERKAQASHTTTTGDALTGLI